jgi:hypothetical protein
MRTWPRSHLVCCLNYFKPIVRRAPSSRLRIREFRILVVDSKSIRRKLVSIESGRWHISANIHHRLLSVKQFAFKRKCPRIFSGRNNGLISSRTWRCVIWLHVPVNYLFTKCLSSSAESISCIALAMDCKSRCCIIRFE